MLWELHAVTSYGGYANVELNVNRQSAANWRCLRLSPPISFPSWWCSIRGKHALAA